VDDRILGGFMKSIAALLLALTLTLSAFAQSNLTFITKATDSHDREYSAYLDLSTKHMEGTYTTMTSYALWATPITSDGYSGIKWYKNVLQIDCARNVKRLKYIGYLDVNGNVIVEESYPDAQDEAISTTLVDSKEKPYYCGQ
jgi:hypothetical protein